MVPAGPVSAEDGGAVGGKLQSTDSKPRSSLNSLMRLPRSCLTSSFSMPSSLNLSSYDKCFRLCGTLHLLHFVKEANLIGAPSCNRKLKVRSDEVELKLSP